jgi:polyphosphate kinase
MAEENTRKDQQQNNRATALAEFKTKHPYMQNRELSWLEFNKRVLDQGTDPTVPLLERLSFISIYWSNLQEFFMVRVGSLADLALVKQEIIDAKSGMTPTEQLDAIYARARELYPDYQRAYSSVKSLLAEQGIENLHGHELSPEQQSFAQDYFEDNVMPFLSPQIINTRHPFPHLENGAIYIVVRLDEAAFYGEGEASATSGGTQAAAMSQVTARKTKGGKSGKSAKGGKDSKTNGTSAKAKHNRGADGVTLGLIPLPKQCERIVQLPGKDLKFILLEHLIEHFAHLVFSMYKIKHTNIICVTRNADLDATEGSEEQGEDYREHMKKILKKRKRLAPVRLESERALSSTVKAVLLERLNLDEHQTFVTSVPLDMSYVYDIAVRLNPKKAKKLSIQSFTPAWPAALERNRPIMDQLQNKDVLLSFPYNTISAFVQLLREAAVDPSVISIKITLYRLAKQSHIAEALIAAAEAGKEVTAVFELRARFDESNNIEWSQRFEQAGCNVLYGYRNYKIHSKICVITRRTEHGLEHITQIGTGNYNEKTAALYTDFFFLTCNKSIGRDAMHYFHNIALENISDDYDILWVSPLQIKQNIMSGIDDQISRAQKGLPNGLFFKTNSITDRELIEKIVEASQAGVHCTLLVRGISCIVPGVEGFTDNVRVVSIVGRLLEHSRIYVFGPIDDPSSRVYMSSADLMTRNMDKRVEVAWPILNDELRTEALGYIATCLADTAKLRELLPNGQYTPLGIFTLKNNKEGGAEAIGSNSFSNTHNDQSSQSAPYRLFDAQKFLIGEAQRQHLRAAERIAAASANDIDHVRELELAESAECATQAKGSSQHEEPNKQQKGVQKTYVTPKTEQKPQGTKTPETKAPATSPSPSPAPSPAKQAAVTAASQVEPERSPLDTAVFIISGIAGVIRSAFKR